MENRPNRTVAIAVVAAVVALLLGLCGGAVVGGMAGYALGRGARTDVTAPGRFVQPLPNPEPFSVTPAAPRSQDNGQDGGLVSGVVVQEVVAGSPAEQAGIQPGDVVTQVDNTTLDAQNLLADVLAQHKPGDRVRLTILRGGGTVGVNVRLGASPADAQRPYLGIRYTTTSVPVEPTRAP